LTSPALFAQSQGAGWGGENTAKLFRHCGVYTASDMFNRHVITKLDALLDGRLSARKSARVRAHLEQCDACRQEWETQSAVWAKLGESQSIQPSSTFTERVLRNLDKPTEVGAGNFAESHRTWSAQAEEVADARRGLASVVRWIGAPAAAVVVGVAVSSAVFFFGDHPHHHDHGTPPMDAPNAPAIDQKFIESRVRAQLQQDEAEHILRTLESLKPEEREEYLHRVWDAHKWNKEDLRRLRKD
jgi:hypothetical protein